MPAAPANQVRPLSGRLGGKAGSVAVHSHRRGRRGRTACRRNPCVRERETMHRGRFVFAVALALVAASAQAAAPPIVSTDFTLQDMKRLPTNWTFNGFAGLEANP